MRTLAAAHKCLNLAQKFNGCQLSLYCMLATFYLSFV